MKRSGKTPNASSVHAGLRALAGVKDTFVKPVTRGRGTLDLKGEYNDHPGI